MANSFEWHEDKAALNERKHGVSFAEAATVFGNPLAAIFDDPDHSSEELREIIVGHSDHDRLLVVSFTARESVVRIISARKATPGERQDYQENPLRGWRHE
jgi:uncharacterized DUF497 family protein